jgi:hypothetical protein
VDKHQAFVKTGKSVNEILALLTLAYGEYALKKLSVLELHRQFKEGRKYVQDDPRSGQPKMQRTNTNVDRVQTLMRSDRRSETVWRKGPKFWPDIWILHCEDVRAHHALTVPEFMAKRSITKLDHQLYSPD